MPRYTQLAPTLRVLEQRVPAVATGADAETVIGEAPFDGFVSLVRYLPDAAYTGAATNYRSLYLRNKFPGGTGVTVIASFDGTSGNNLVAATENAIALAATIPAAPAYAVQPTTTPTAAPVLSNGTGSLTAGLYEVAYSYVVNGVEGPLSPYATNVQGGSNGIAVAAIQTPPGVASVRYYFLVSPGTAGLVTTQSSGAAVTLNAQGNGTLPSGFSVGDVTKGDVLAFRSLHQGTGLADPGGLVRVTFTQG